MTPSGKPASVANRQIKAVVKGAFSLVLTTIVFPAATAGPTWGNWMSINALEPVELTYFESKHNTGNVPG